MAASGFTPIQPYYSTTATNVPLAANLVTGELALNTNDGKLYFKNSAGAVTLIASTASVSGVSVTGILKSNGTTISAAVAGTDYAPVTSGTSILYGNGSGGFSNVTIGTGLTFVGGTLTGTSSGIAYFLSAQSTSAPNATIPVVSLNVTDAGYANLDLALVAKGTGATLAQIPDGTTAGGDKRGIYSTDFQKSRAAATRVASGDYSTIAGGSSNSATANYAGALSGIANQATNASAVIAGGSNNIASGNTSTVAGGSANTASGNYAFVGGGQTNTASGQHAFVGGGSGNTASFSYNVVAGGQSNSSTALNSSVVGGGSFNSVSAVAAVIAGGNSLNIGTAAYYGGIVGGQNNYLNNSFSSNSDAGRWSFIGGGATNNNDSPYSVVGGGLTNTTTDTSVSAAITTQSATTVGGNVNVTLSASNFSIRAGQYITGTGIAAGTLVSSVSGTSLVLSKVASSSGTNTLSFWASNSVVGGGSLNRALGTFSFIGGGGDLGPATVGNLINSSTSFCSIVGGRGNTVSNNADFAFIGGGRSNTIGGSSLYCGVVSGISNSVSGFGSAVVSGIQNTVSSASSYSTILNGQLNNASGSYNIISGSQGTDRGVSGVNVFSGTDMVAYASGVSQTTTILLGRQTTTATPTTLTTNISSTASATNQLVLPSNSAYYFRGEIIATVTGGGNTKGWYIEGVIKQGAGAGSTALVGTPTITSNYADAGASAWTIGITANTTLGCLTITATGQASTTIRWVANIRTTEVAY